MNIVKVFNNNIVLVKNEQTQKESILWGKGVGFQKKVGQEITIKEDDAVFVKEAESEWARSFLSLSEEIPMKYFDVAKKIVKEAEEDMDISFNPFLLISLADHIFFTVQRASQKSDGGELPINEIKDAYNREFIQAEKSKELIEHEFSVVLQANETGFLAIHFVENEKESIKNFDKSKMAKDNAISDILKIASDKLNLNIKENKVNVQRLKTHLKFLLTRIQNKEFFVDTEEDVKLYQQIIKSYPQLQDCALSITDYLEQKFNYKLSESERIYLIMHLRQISKQANAKEGILNEDK